MNAREQLLQELDHAPDILVEKVLDFCLFIKNRPSIAQPEDQPIPEHNSGLLSLLTNIQMIQAEVPAEEWQKMPRDGSINHDHYLYGSPKLEQ
jgi:hypothetical protein